MRGWLWVVCLVPMSSWAQASLSGASAWSAPREVLAWVGTDGVALGGQLPLSLRRALTGEVQYSPPDAAGGVWAVHRWQLLGEADSWVGLSAQLGLALKFTTAGPFDAGGGPVGGITGGIGLGHSSLGPRWRLELGVQTAGEYFTRSGGPRWPTRLWVGTAVQLGPLRLGVYGRAGADFEPGRYPTGRFEGWFTAAYAL